MREDLAQKTYEILLQGLKLRERLASGERPLLKREQATLQAMLGPANVPAPWGSEHDPNASSSGTLNTRGFLGIRYALTCWLDELFSQEWREWNESKLEQGLYRTALRAHSFWEQSRVAEATPSAADAQEAFLLCVLLGFRGEKDTTPEALKDWVNGMRSRVTRGLGKQPSALPERAPISEVPPLMGVEKYRIMTQWMVAVLLFAALATPFLIVILAGRLN